MKKPTQFGTATIVNERRINFAPAIEAANVSRQVRKRKYGNKKVRVDGILFDSEREARHYGVLKIRVLCGEISNLRLQVKYRLEINGILITTYKPDFIYTENGKDVFVDVKGVRTRMFVMRKKLMKAIHNIDIVEVM